MLQGDPLHHQGYPGIPPGGVPPGGPPGGGVQDQILIYLITYTSKFNLMTHSHLICIYIAYIIYLLIQNHNKDVRKVRKLVWTDCIFNMDGHGVFCILITRVLVFVYGV